MDWDVFTQRFNVWLYDEQAKTCAALKRAAAQIPDAVLCGLPPLRIFTPLRADSSVSLMVETTGQVFGSAVPLTLMYISPLEELYPQEDVDFTVAHEFAHVALGHLWSINGGREQGTFRGRRHGDSPAEMAADRLAESWGFRKTDF
jgi:hypothetical protein